MAEVPSGSAEAMRTAIMVRMARAGATQRYIGEVLGVSAATVCRRLRAFKGRRRRAAEVASEAASDKTDI